MEGGDVEAAKSLGRVGGGEIVAGGDDDGAARHLCEREARGDGSWAQGSQVGDVVDGRGMILN